MIVIFGGAYQGKLDFALKLLHIRQCNVSNIFDCKNETEIDFNKNINIISNLHLLILNQINNSILPDRYIKENIHKFKDKIILCEDLSCGIVPIDENIRLWREAVGSCFFLLSENAEEIYRMFCGIETKLK